METIKKYIHTNSSQVSLWWRRQSLRRKLFYGILLVLVVLFIVSRGRDDRIFEQARIQNIQRTIVASGKVVSTTDLSLSFDSTGVVRGLSVEVGDKVTRGQILATLDQRSQRAAVNAARGRVLSAQARYQRVLDGSSNEEIALAQVNLDSAKRDLEATKKVQDSLVANARIRLLSEGLVAEPVTTLGSTTTVIPIIGGSYTGDFGDYELTIRSLGSGFVNYTGIESGVAEISTTITKPFGTKGLTILFPSSYTSRQGGSWRVRIPNPSAPGYIQNMNAYNQAQQTRDAAVANAQAIVDTREAELALRRATARRADVDAALAEVITAQAGLEEAQVALERTVLRAPSDGTITAVDIKIGQVAQALSQAMILQDISNLYIEAEVGESNISLLSTGLPVTISFDAFSNSTPTYSTVSSIDPAATVNNNIVSYKLKSIIPNQEEKQIKPGMTATIVVTALQKNGALVVPRRVVQEEDGENVVQKVVQDGRKEEIVRQPVTLGIRADGDLIEILSGLAENDRVLWDQDKK